MTAADVFGLRREHGAMRNRGFQSGEFLLYFLVMLWIAEIDFFSSTFVFLFSKLFVEDAIFFVAKTDAADTIGATLEVETVEEIVAVVAILTVETAVELATIDTFVTEFAVSQDERVDAIFGIIRRTVVAVL